jgi:hypothetical protein
VSDRHFKDKYGTAEHEDRLEFAGLAFERNFNTGIVESGGGGDVS